MQRGCRAPTRPTMAAALSGLRGNGRRAEGAAPGRGGGGAVQERPATTLTARPRGPRHAPPNPLPNTPPGPALGPSRLRRGLRAPPLARLATPPSVVATPHQSWPRPAWLRPRPRAPSAAGTGAGAGVRARVKVRARARARAGQEPQAARAGSPPPPLPLPNTSLPAGLLAAAGPAAGPARPWARLAPPGTRLLGQSCRQPAGPRAGPEPGSGGLPEGVEYIPTRKKGKNPMKPVGVAW